MITLEQYKNAVENNKMLYYVYEPRLNAFGVNSISNNFFIKYLYNTDKAGSYVAMTGDSNEIHFKYIYLDEKTAAKEAARLLLKIYGGES